MYTSPRFALLALVLVTASCASSPPSPSSSSAPYPSEVVAEASALRFRSSFWMNVHHVLYAAAWARRNVPPFESRAGVFLAPLDDTKLAPDERAAWERAVAHYDRELADKDLLFDDRMGDIRQALAAADGSTQLPAGLGAEHGRALAEAAPVYRAHWWATHDRANRAWIEATAARVRSLSPLVPDRLASLYGKPWFTTPVRVDVVFVANRQSAYTSTIPGPPHITISSSDSHTQGWAAAEIVFHESSHALVGPVEEAFARAASAQAKTLPVLWHVALFYLTGEVVRQTLAMRAIDYTPYVYSKGLFARGWGAFREPLETHWRPYVDGKATLSESAAKVVAACPARVDAW